MTAPDRADGPRRSGLRAQLPALVLTLAIFGVIFWRIPFGRFAEAIASASLLPFLCLIGAMSTCYFLVDTLVLSRLIQWFHGPIAYRELLPVRAVTYIVSIVNTQLAQGALALYIHRRFQTPLGEIASTVAFLILLEVTNLIGFATAGSLFFPGGTPLAMLAIPAVLIAVWFGVIRIARGGLGPLGRWIGGNVLLSTFRRAGWRHGLLVVALKASILLLSILVHSQALGFFGIHIPLHRLLAFLPIVFLVGALPVTVAHLGTSQAAWIFFFRGHAAEADLLAYSLASHLTFMLANGFFGLIFLPKAYADLFVRGRAR